jgi:hypothetical protein
MASLTRKARWTTTAAAFGLLVVVPTACETLRDPLTVEPASRIPSAVAEVSANAQLLSDGAIADFECAFGSYTVIGGLVGEEFIYAQQTASRTPYDRRNTSKDDADYAVNACNSGSPGVYTPLQVARASNENLLRLLNSWTDEEVAAGANQPNRTNLIGISSAYAGYSLVLLGEGFCSMAISYVNPDNTFTFGGEITRDSVFRLAIVRFTDAITAATTVNNTIIRNMAYVGRARAKLNLGDYPGAKADAALVPAGYARNVSVSDVNTRRQNRVFLENSALNRSLSIGEPYRALSDPRVPTSNGGTVSATGVQHWFQTKYAASNAVFPLATYEEAQLIIAEADIRANSLATALPIIAASRTRGGQGVFTGTTQAQYLAELIDQRRRELFAESHHLGDAIRFNLALTPAVGSNYHFGGSYGTQVCLPLPAAERLNNPLIGG